MTNAQKIRLIEEDSNIASKVLLDSNDKIIKYYELIRNGLLILGAPHTTKDIQSCKEMALLEIVKNN